MIKYKIALAISILTIIGMVLRSGMSTSYVPNELKSSVTKEEFKKIRKDREIMEYLSPFILDDVDNLPVDLSGSVYDVDPYLLNSVLEREMPDRDDVRAGKFSYSYYGGEYSSLTSRPDLLVVMHTQPNVLPHSYINVLFLDGHIETVRYSEFYGIALARHWILP